MKQLWKRIIIVVLVLAALGGITYYVNRQPAIQYQQGLYPINPELAGSTIIQQDYIRYPGKQGQNVFELLKDAVGEDQVKFKQYDFGVFIEEINGLKPDAEHFWKLYYNGHDAQVAADKLQTNTGDIIEWLVEKINK